MNRTVERIAPAPATGGFKPEGVTMGELVAAQQRIKPALVFGQTADNFLSAIRREVPQTLRQTTLPAVHPWGTLTRSGRFHAHRAFT